MVTLTNPSEKKPKPAKVLLYKNVEDTVKLTEQLIHSYQFKRFKHSVIHQEIF